LLFFGTNENEGLLPVRAVTVWGFESVVDGNRYTSPRPPGDQLTTTFFVMLVGVGVGVVVVVVVVVGGGANVKLIVRGVPAVPVAPDPVKGVPVSW